ncbi:MAG: DUF47 domain-containing protein [Promethearchaeota archaeon]
MNNEFIRILNSIIEHSKYIDIAIRETVKAVEAWLNNKREDLEQAVKRATQAESDANKLKIKLMKRIAEAEAAINRTDFLRLVLKMDLIPDYIEGAAVRISYVDVIPKEEHIIKGIKDLLDAILDMSSTFKMTIRSIRDNPSNTEKFCNEIDEKEERIDEIFRKLESDLFNSELEIKKMFQIRNVMFHIEETGDLCHENADHIRILIATL